MHGKVKTIFCGSGEFAVPVLSKLQQLDFLALSAVITQPDRPAGRKRELTPTPVKAAAMAAGLKIYQPDSLKADGKRILKDESPRLIIVADYGQLLPDWFLVFPEFGSINVHASLLPAYRGAIPIRMSLLNGELKTGVTIMLMDEGLDTGPVLSFEELPIAESDNYITLSRKLAAAGADLLEKTLPHWLEGRLQAKQQDNELATSASKDLVEHPDFSPEIRFEQSGEKSKNKIRAYADEGAWVMVNHAGSRRRIKIFRAGTVKAGKGSSKEPVFHREGKKLILQLENSAVEILELQLEGRKRDIAVNYLFLAE
jgi:methionyl-tRNA formyltransferase